MEQLLNNETLIAALVAALVIIIGALGKRIAAAIEGWGRAGQALSETQLRQSVADDVVAAVEQLLPDADGGDKLQRALDLASERGTQLVRAEIEAALKRAEGAWREPDWVKEQFEAEDCGGVRLVGPEGNG